MELPVDEPDASARLRKIVERTSMLKSSNAALGAATMIDLTALAPPILHALMARSLYASRLFNVTITNVPGPRMPLYAFGAALREDHPLVPLAAGHAVGIAIISYNGGMVLGLNADCDSTPDLHVLAEGVEEGFAELRMLLGSKAARPSVKPKSTKPKSTKAKSTKAKSTKPKSTKSDSSRTAAAT